MVNRIRNSSHRSLSEVWARYSFFATLSLTCLLASCSAIAEKRVLEPIDISTLNTESQIGVALSMILATVGSGVAWVWAQRRAAKKERRALSLDQRECCGIAETTLRFESEQRLAATEEVFEKKLDKVMEMFVDHLGEAHMTVATKDDMEAVFRRVEAGFHSINTRLDNLRSPQHGSTNVE